MLNYSVNIKVCLTTKTFIKHVGILFYSLFAYFYCYKDVYQFFHKTTETFSTHLVQIKICPLSIL